MERLYTEKLDIAYDQKMIVRDMHLVVPQGKITALIGPNGSGKSTILKTMARIHAPKNGAVYLDGKCIHEQPTKEIAKQLAILPQTPTAPDGLSVSELVAYGRFPHQKGFGVMNQEDRTMVEWALSVTGMSRFKDRTLDQLSGGQRQRAWIAMALAQGTDILFLDEPTTYLDMAHQLEVLSLLKTLNQEQNKTIMLVVHDLNHASRYADHIVAIADGQIMREGTPFEVITRDVLRNVFGVEADIVPDPRSGVPLCLPFGLSREHTELHESTRKQATEDAERHQPVLAK